ncbi:AraC family transcriptional regulator [Paenibacillus aceris]|uniref:AraC-like DNA-binding protein/diadenosine tetraphosphate (Ap4A) HIT family hydrolase n=1 Tax=Paenibacillus aceris TaxID=869555 RepID=A0ABS4HX16_9BACL|nr:AraC family transcriptional regulator [Paenibacillus aceris]MBP1963197.1 AraC-like DNA-binding protein/diadenosine tetraphosphate (Ap4A) HIT family hydrolase [Paenibacillus aceris]NHW38686.1 AraC family transcriptional regulator [Paenibacillus aceris]
MSNSKYEYLEADLLAHYSSSTYVPNEDFHFHDNYEIFLFLNGEINLFLDQYCYPLERGHLLVINNHEIHKIFKLTPNPYERITIHFKPQIVLPFCSSKTNLLSCFQNHKPGENNIVQLNEAQIEAYMSLATKLIEVLDQNKYGSDVLSFSYLTQILVFTNDIFRRTSSTVPSITSSLIQSVMSYIDNNLLDELTLDRIAKELSVDKFHLSRMFKLQTGGSVYRYILLKRVAQAKQLLSTGYSVSEACHLSGFNDYANFIRTFKKITGSSPGQYGKST